MCRAFSLLFTVVYIFIHHLSDLILQRHWSNHHHTIRSGSVDYGCIDIGVYDTNSEETLPK